jgi:hypothetical protein
MARELFCRPSSVDSRDRRSLAADGVDGLDGMIGRGNRFADGGC